MKHYDIVIVGAGPAGSTAAYHLAKNKRSVLLIDKAVFPRHKLCGGLLTQKTVDCIEQSYHEAFSAYKYKTNSVEIAYHYKPITKITTDIPFYLTDRRELDFYLLSKCIELGIEIRQNTKITSAEHQAKTLILSDGTEVTYDFLIGADGANSQIRKHIDPKYRANGFCMEINSSALLTDTIVIHFGCVKKGYGWVFPKNEYSTIGYGSEISEAKKTSGDFNVYLSALHQKPQKAQGAFVPFGKYIKCPCKNNILLTGDAAGLVDPVTGEGIYFAVKSGEYAAESILEYYEKNADVSEVYSDKINTMHKLIDSANRSRMLVFNPAIQSIVFPLMSKHKNFIKYLCDNAVSFYNQSYKGSVVKYLMNRGK